ncbi:MAG: hypothetical protein HY077_06455 [Elusimicrobia bacterium]|nr:hypothetical protein [Elusimicrobiota bacterium]
MIKSPSPRLRTVLLLFFFGAVVAGALWTRLPGLGPEAVLLLCLLVVAAASARGAGLDVPVQLLKNSWSTPELRSLLLGSVMCAPVLVYLMMTWGQEFAFRGDDDFHLFAAAAAARFWIKSLPALALSLGALALAARRWRASLWSLAALGLLLALGWAGEASEPALVRYPAVFYFFSTPLVILSRVLQWDSPVNANRLLNALALPCWLFALRPALLGRAPDRRAALFCAYFFFQKHVVYYFASAYLEPWSLVLSLTAVESLLDDDRSRPWLPCLLVGGAAMIKEQAILLLPFFWIASYGRRGVRSLIGPEPLLVMSCSGAPFLLYFAARRQAGVWRHWVLRRPDDLFSAARAQVYWQHLRFQFGGSGLALCLGAILCALFLSCWKNRRRWECAWLAAAALGQALFFYADGWSGTGYPRFQLFTAALIGASLFVASDLLDGPRRRAIYAAALGTILLLNAPGLVEALRLGLGPDPERSFIEDYDAPIYLPIRRLVRQAEREGALADGTRIAVNTPMPQNEVDLIRTAYADLARRHAFVFPPRSFLEPVCRCGPDAPAVLMPLVRMTGLAEGRSQPPARLAVEAGCLREIAAACGRVFKAESRPGGVLYGMLGTPR